MTALDQAFIKAFSQQDVPLAAIASRGVVPASEKAVPDRNKAASLPTPLPPPSPPALPTPASLTHDTSTLLSLSEIFGGVLEALEKTPNQPCDKTDSPIFVDPRCATAPAKIGTVPRPTAPSKAKVEHGVGSTTTLQLDRKPSNEPREPWTVGNEPWAVSSEQWTIGCEPWAMSGTPWVASEETQDYEPQVSCPENRVSSPEFRVPSPEPLAPSIKSLTPSPEALVPSLKPSVPPAPPLSSFHLPLTPEEPSEQRTFQPAWQVERFSWPKVCRRLIGRAAVEFDRLADALVNAKTKGQQVFAIGGCRPGEGATTLLLCAARRLAERGIKSVLVDADLTRPRLAKRLGVQPQFGWDESSEEEERSFDQAIVESAANNLALLPIREPSADGHRPTGDVACLGPCLDILRQHYDMVLVDLGPLKNAGPIREALARSNSKKIDAVLLVHNRQVTPEEELTEVERQLSAAGIPVAGVIENFVVES